mmetsp:Transcript_72633/g.201418  ORF Transcript_72633/g.201418 Transcript_72633/m.201418 type:complete len:257 (-) Transcript_72633:16-786(-)
MPGLAERRVVNPRMSQAIHGSPKCARCTRRNPAPLRGHPGWHRVPRPAERGVAECGVPPILCATFSAARVRQIETVAVNRMTRGRGRCDPLGVLPNGCAGAVAREILPGRKLTPLFALVGGDGVADALLLRHGPTPGLDVEGRPCNLWSTVPAVAQRRWCRARPSISAVPDATPASLRGSPASGVRRTTQVHWESGRRTWWNRRATCSICPRCRLLRGAPMVRTPAGKKQMGVTSWRLARSHRRTIDAGVLGMKTA